MVIDESAESDARLPLNVGDAAFPCFASCASRSARGAVTVAVVESRKEFLAGFEYLNSARGRGSRSRRNKMTGVRTGMRVPRTIRIVSTMLDT